MHITSRDEDNNTRKKRQAQLKRGPGVFVYDGSLEDTVSHPMPLLTGDRDVVLDDKGFPVTDRAGRVSYKPAGRVVVDTAGRPVMGGAPRIERNAMETVTIRDVVFAAGKPVKVDASLALKLRGMPGFAEVEAKAEVKESTKAEAKEAKAEVDEVKAEAHEVKESTKAKAKKHDAKD
jgi:hypothetical protein